MTLTWSVVSTVHAPAWLLSMHAAHLTALGCRQIVYLLDRPEDFDRSAFDDACANVTFVRCDDAYWKLYGGKPPTVPLRQIRNLEFAKLMVEGDYILHIDADEFLCVNGTVAEVLASFPQGSSSIRLQNVERILVTDRDRWIEGVVRKFTRDAALVQRVYGARSAFMHFGLSSYIHGKSFTRNSPDICATVHGEMVGIHEGSRCTVPLDRIMLVHFDCIAPRHWAWKLLQRAEDLKAGLRMFPHERRMIEFVRRAPDRTAAVDRLVEAMHMAAPEAAEHWKSVGIVEELPAGFLAELEQAARDPRLLSCGEADRRLAAFYRVRPAQLPDTGSA